MTGEHRISNFMAVLLIMVALIADLFTLIPFVGDIVGPIYWFIMTFYLWKTGHGIVNVKMISSEAISFIAEVIPMVQALPTIFASTIVIIIFSRREERSMSKGESEPQEDIEQMGEPLYENGVRKPRDI